MLSYSTTMMVLLYASQPTSCTYASESEALSARPYHALSLSSRALRQDRSEKMARFDQRYTSRKTLRRGLPRVRMLVQVCWT